MKEFSLDSECEDFVDFSCNAQEKVVSPEAHLDTSELKNLVTPIKTPVYSHQRVVI